MVYMTRHTLDARYLLCPLPVIRTQNKMKDLSMGDLLMVTCTDPGAINDIPAWCRINGHKVIHTATVDKEITITIEASQNK